jgi:molybdopterin converting factor small subunit
MTVSKQTITIKVRLFAGLDQDAGLNGYDRQKGLDLIVPRGARLKKVVKMIGLPDRHLLAFFINGERVGLRRKLEDGDEISCLKPAAGG